MNTQTKEKLVSLVASGTDTYEQILRAIPELTENAFTTSHTAIWTKNAFYRK